MTLTKNVIVELIHMELGCSVKEARDILEMLIEELKIKLEEGEQVKISGFGKWMVREKKRRPGRNPYTGHTIEISARRVVTFHPSEKLRKAVNESKKPVLRKLKSKSKPKSKSRFSS